MEETPSLPGQPLVSVVVATRDRPDVVQDAVQSVLAQTYPRFELIVVDDASEPPLRLEEVLATDPRVRLFRNERPLRQAAAKNLGVARSRGELVAFLDDDDLWHPQKLERQVNVLCSAPPRVAAAECGYDLRAGARLVHRYVPDAARDLQKTVLQNPPMQTSTVLIRRSAFEALGGFDARVVRADDWELWIRLADHYEVAVVAEVLVDRRTSDHDPGYLLWGYQEMLQILGPRIDRLPTAERRRLQGYHVFNLGVLTAMAGNRLEARRLLWTAWRTQPRHWRPLAHIGRTLIGERTWRYGTELLRSFTHPLLRALGREPLIRSW